MSVNWARAQVLSRLFSHPKTPQAAPTTSTALTFDCLWLIFAECEALFSRDPALDRSSDPVRGFLYDVYDVNPAVVRRQLSACSLVCKAWKLPAQLRMLHSTKLYRAAQAQSFIAFLSAYHLAGNAVQSLELGKESPERATFLTLSRWHIFEILRRSHRIQSLTLHEWRPDDNFATKDTRSPSLPPISLDVLSRHAPFERLITLRLFRYFGTLRKIVDLLLLTPALENLSFEGSIDYYEDANAISSLPPPPFQLRRLSVMSYDLGHLRGYEWLLSNSWNTLVRLDLGSTVIDQDLIHGLEVHGSSIQFLSVTHHAIYKLQNIAPLIALIRACPRIRALRIDGTFSPPVINEVYFLRHCLQALSSKLESLNIVYTLPGVNSTFRSPSAQEMINLIHDIQTMDCLSRLAYLTFEFSPEHAYPDVPLTQLRMLTDVCLLKKIELSLPDYYDLVMGPAGTAGRSGGGGGGSNSNSRQTRHGRFFSMHI